MQSSEPAELEQDNFGGKLDASGSKGAKLKTKEALKVPTPASMSLKNFFKPQATPTKTSDDVDMHETHQPAPQEPKYLVLAKGTETAGVDVEMEHGSLEGVYVVDPSNSKENGG